jgi:hypothetical protein
MHNFARTVLCDSVHPAGLLASVIHRPPSVSNSGQQGGGLHGPGPGPQASARPDTKTGPGPGPGSTDIFRVRAGFNDSNQKLYRIF